MSDTNAWLFFDGPEPEHLRPLMDALRDLPPATEEDKERRVRWLSERFDPELARQGEPSGATSATAAALAQPPTHPRMGTAGEVGEDGATASSPSLDERPAAPPPVDPPSPPVDAREPRPPEVRSIEDLKITSLDLDVPAEFRVRRESLPFKPRAPETDFARTMQVPVRARGQGETMPLGDDSIAKAVAALPFAGNTVGPALVPFPRLSLEAYASLRAELSIWPERSAKILPRYHVMNEAALRALEQHWELELAASPEARARFDLRLVEYTTWLRARRV